MVWDNAFQTGGHGMKKINISFYGKGPPIIYFYIEIRLRGATEQKSLKTYGLGFKSQFPVMFINVTFTGLPRFILHVTIPREDYFFKNFKKVFITSYTFLYTSPIIFLYLSNLLIRICEISTESSGNISPCHILIVMSNVKIFYGKIDSKMLLTQKKFHQNLLIFNIRKLLKTSVGGFATDCTNFAIFSHIF